VRRRQRAGSGSVGIDIANETRDESRLEKKEGKEEGESAGARERERQ